MNENQSSLGRPQLTPPKKQHHNRRVVEILSYAIQKSVPQMAEIEYQRIQNLSKNEAETYPASPYLTAHIAISS